MLQEWGLFSTCSNGDAAVGVMEPLSHKTRAHPVVRFDFDSLFYKFPSYLRRSAVAKAFALVSSYHSNLND